MVMDKCLWKEVNFQERSYYVRLRISRNSTTLLYPRGLQWRFLMAQSPTVCSLWWAAADKLFCLDFQLHLSSEASHTAFIICGRKNKISAEYKHSMRLFPAKTITRCRRQKNQNWLSPYFSPSFFSGSHVIITKRRPYLYNTYFLSNRGKKFETPRWLIFH